MDFIDVEKAIQNKNPKLLKVMPGFLIAYLKRIIRQDDLNALLKEHGHLKGLEFIQGALQYMNITYQAHGTENIPRKGRFVFASNHPLGGLDGLVFILEVGKIFPDLKFPVNDLLMNVTNLDNVFLPVNKHGSQAKEAARQIEEAYASDAQILYFPAGLCSRKRKGEIKDLEWKKSFISKAIQHERDIIPVHFEGRNSNFFYNLANFRVMLGIKSNFEMVYLPNEMFKQTGKNIVMTFGKPVSYKTIRDSDLSHQEWANRLREQIHRMDS
jgi:putative hemolysin